MIRAVLFDLDGTLLDSAPDLVASLNWLRAKNGLAELPLPDMRNFAGRGAIGLLHAGMPVTDSDTLERWRLEFLAHYEQHPFHHSRLFDGVEAMLDGLMRMGVSWGIVTNKPEYLTMPIIEASGLKSGLGCLVCGDSISERKPHPAPVELACSLLGMPPRNTLFVGDDVRDLEAGVGAGTLVCAAHYGYGLNELKNPDNARWVEGAPAISHPAEVMSLVEAAGQRPAAL